MNYQLSANEHDKLEQLRRVKLLATLVLFACFLVLVAAKMLEAKYPGLAYVAAFAEAATIGGIADWYAVVALFKRPLNMPIPHTAIIPNNQDRIANNLGAFLEKNFLNSGVVDQKLAEVDFSEQISKWLADREKSARLAIFFVQMAPKILTAIEGSGIRSFAGRQFALQLEKTNLAPVMTSALSSVIQNGQHQKLLSDLLAAMHRFLSDETAIEAISEQIQRELPAVFNLVRVDAMILKRILKATNALLDEIENDPDHKIRAEFEQFLKNYVRRMKRSRKFAKRVDVLKMELLERPEFANAAYGIWESLKRFIQEDVTSDHSVLENRLSGILSDFGMQLENDPELKKQINSGVVSALSSFVDQQKSGISAFVSSQVKSWDLGQLTLLIEANIGKDLQYIRFNGMIIGGIAGLVLHVFETQFLTK